MKLKASEIALIIGAVLVVGLIAYNFIRNNSANTVATEQDGATKSIQAVNDKPTVSFSTNPDELQKQLRHADDRTAKAFIRYVIDQPLPEDFEYPQYLLEAGSIEASVEAIGARFPQFYKKRGNNLIQAVKKDPVAYIEMIKHTRAYREIYSSKVGERFVDTTVTRPAGQK